MSHRLARFAFAATLSVGCLAAFASAASATYHENLIREIHKGNGTNGDYVELQAYSAGQNLVAGKHIVVYDGGGGSTPFSDYTIPSNVGNAANQATILISNGGVTGADFTAGSMTGEGNLNIVNTGSTVCYTDSSITVKLDCVAFQGTMNPVTVPSGANFGTPFALPGNDLNNQTLVRTISRGCPTALDPADDTNGASDFTLGTGNPRGNPTTPTETVCPPAPPASPSTGTAKKKCKKKKKHKRSAESAKKKKCKKKKRH